MICGVCKIEILAAAPSSVKRFTRAMSAAARNGSTGAPGAAVVGGPGYLALRAECELATFDSEGIR